MKQKKEKFLLIFSSPQKKNKTRMEICRVQTHKIKKQKKYDIREVKRRLNYERVPEKIRV